MKLKFPLLAVTLLLVFTHVSSALAEQLLITSRSGVKLRKKVQGKRIGGIPGGATVTVLDRNGNWALVKRGKTKGWIYTPKATRAVEASAPAEKVETATAAATLEPRKMEPQHEERVALQTQSDSKAILPAFNEHSEKFGEKHGAMKFDPTAASGACTLRQIKTDAQARALLDYYDVKTPGSNPNERINLANGLFQASALYGGKFKPFTGVTVKYSSRKGFANYDNGVINLNRCDKRGKHCGAGDYINVARLMHEFGHRFGHASFSGSTTYYDKFAQLRGCHPTGYSDNDVAENTAEIMSAYLTRPLALSGGSKACKRVYRFLSKEVFKTNGNLASCDTASKQKLLASIRGGSSFETAFLSPAKPDVELASAIRRDGVETAEASN